MSQQGFTPGYSSPPAPNTYDPSHADRVAQDINKALSSTVSTTRAADGVMLQAPNGSVYKITVDNSGSITATAVPLGQTGSVA